MYLLDDEEDVHYCGRCKLSFTDLSEYIKHKANKVCRDTNKSTLTEVVDKLPISLNKSPEKSKEQCSDGAEGTQTNASKKGKDDEATGEDASQSPKRVEVQFLEPLVASESEDGPVEDDAVGCKNTGGEKSGGCLILNPFTLMNM